MPITVLLLDCAPVSLLDSAECGLCEKSYATTCLERRAGLDVAYFKQRADNGENHNGEQGHDNAVDLISLFVQTRLSTHPYHVHAFIADTTGLTMVGDLSFGIARRRMMQGGAFRSRGLAESSRLCSRMRWM